MSFFTRSLLKPGDCIVLAAGAALVASAFAWSWQAPRGDRVVVRAKGKTVAEIALSSPRTLEVAGVLGASVIEVRDRKVRVARDPGPRQLCVRQGWIGQSGEALLCLANQVSLEIPGRAPAYDSLNY